MHIIYELVRVSHVCEVMAKSNCKIYIVEQFEERRTRGSDKTFIVGMICEGETEKESSGKSDSSSSRPKNTMEGAVVNKVMPCYLNDTGCDTAKKITSISVGKRVMLTNVIRSPSCFRITGMSKVISKVCDFPVDMTAVTSFIKPDIVSVPEAKGSPLKRRLSVHGDVVAIGDYIETVSYKRRTLKLEGGGANVDVVLWGEAASDSRLVQSGDSVTITALLKDETRLTSTLSSVIECSTSEGDERKGVLIAIDDESGFPVEMILESGESIYIPQEVDFDFGIDLPVEICYVVSAGMVSTISVLETGC